jgi:UDP-2,3-diacylglucosamine pyrophosphatase LpxH
MKSKYKSIFISDVHLGSRGCKADELCEFLKNNTSENLFLVGDIIDGWRLRQKWYFPQSHANVIRRILTASKRGTNVYYILGNHDEAFRKFLNFDLEIGNIKILNEYSYQSVSDKKILVIHGDMFDSLMLDKKWLMHIGDVVYNFMIWVNIHLNKLRSLFGMKYWSLSNWLKQNTKKALNYINSYEDHLSSYCITHNFDGIICGHIHVSAIKKIGNIDYLNCGDWVESGTAIVEHHDGEFELVEFQIDEENTSNN